MMNVADLWGKRVESGGFPGETWPLGQGEWPDEQAPCTEYDLAANRIRSGYTRASRLNGASSATVLGRNAS
jgi:hypothetical protein